MKKIGIGTQFRWTHADANPVWEVKSSRGGGAWNCEIVESDDYAGARKVFSTEEIRGAIQHAELLKETLDESTRFYHGLTPGAVVHYRSSRGEYVRCRVTDDRQLLPIALVGDWRSSDLPQRNRDGSVYLGYHTKNIKEGKPFHPHCSNIYEYRPQQGEMDPRPLTPLVLELPPMTPQEERKAELWRKVEKIRELTNQDKDPLDILGEILDEVMFLL